MDTAELSPELRARISLIQDFELYARSCLYIRTKAGDIVPLQLNQAQRYVHERIEEQRRKTGRVRALILKARQQGFSTYIEGRFYWKVANQRGLEAFILTHQQSATDALFKMVERYHVNCPGVMKPHTGKANAKELIFDRLGSGYAVGTAGTVAVGRGKTLQYFHGSEVAFWQNAKDHFAGVVQAVPDADGTEIILETTGNGPTGEFYSRWQKAVRGQGDYIALFVPWFWSPEYQRPVPDGFVLAKEDQEYQELHGLTLEQMAWRSAKMDELGDPMLFMQEYPATADEAFQATGHDAFISPNVVLKARKATLEGVGPLILGVDPKREGEDRFSIAWRRGRKLEKIQSSDEKIDTITAAGRVREIIDRDKPAAVFIDVGGNGGAIFDVLVSWDMKYAAITKLVNFGSAALNEFMMLNDGSLRPGPKNRRAEMWLASRQWLEDAGGADIPDLDSLQADATSPGYGYDLQQKLVLESKERIKARGGQSPDEWDAVALTFAEPVGDTKKKPRDRPSANRSWMSS